VSLGFVPADGKLENINRRAVGHVGSFLHIQFNLNFNQANIIDMEKILHQPILGFHLVYFLYIFIFLTFKFIIERILNSGWLESLTFGKI
jgi:hypothetical protein